MARKASTQPTPRLIDNRGRVALPKFVLDALGAKNGEYVAFTLEAGRVHVYKVDWSLRRPHER